MRVDEPNVNLACLLLLRRQLWNYDSRRGYMARGADQYVLMNVDSTVLLKFNAFKVEAHGENDSGCHRYERISRFIIPNSVPAGRSLLRSHQITMLQDKVSMCVVRILVSKLDLVLRYRTEASCV